MQPRPDKRARFLHVLLGGLIVGLVAALVGCSSPQHRTDASFLPRDTITSAVDRDSSLAILTAMKRTAFDSAFAVLDEFSVTRYVRTEQLSPSGTTTALHSSVVRYPPKGDDRDATLTTTDSLGTFRAGGLLGRAASEERPTARPADLVAQVFPDQPAYVEPRTREAFRYKLQADSLRDGTPIHILEVRARDRGTGREQGIRFARLLIHRPSTQLIGLDLVRDDQVLLFGEESRTSIRLEQAPSQPTAWVPAVSRVRSYVDIPFRAPRQYRVVSAYYHYRQ